MAVWPHRSRVLCSRGQRGSSAVELAIITPFIFGFLFFAITAGIAYMQYITIHDSVRVGARFGATSLHEPTNDWAEKVQIRTAESSAGTLSVSQICVELVSGATPTPIAKFPTTCTISSTAKPATPSGLAAADCVVKVWAAKQVVVEAVVTSSTPTLQRGSVTRYERTPCGG